jgi:hypothetical protein
VSAKYRFRAHNATWTRPISAGTSTSGPMIAANAASLWMPKVQHHGEIGQTARRPRDRFERRRVVARAEQAAGHQRGKLALGRLALPQRLEDLARGDVAELQQPIIAIAQARLEHVAVARLR